MNKISYSPDSRPNYLSVSVRYTMFNKGDNIVVILQKGGNPTSTAAAAASNAPDP